MKTVRVALVGAGLVSDSHARGYLEHEDAGILAVCDVNRELAQEKASHWGAKRVYSDFDAVLRDSEVNAVDIMTPPSLHHEMVIRAAEAGFHVNCEKPFCISAKQGREMTECAEKNGIVLAVDESYLFTSSHMRAREMIEAGVIGEPIQIRQRHGSWIPRPGDSITKRRVGKSGGAAALWRSDPVQSGGGAYPWLFDHAVHFFALARYFTLDTDIEWVYSLAAALDRGDRDEGKLGPQATDIPFILWRFQGGRKHGVWMHSGGGKSGYDFRAGFSTLVIGTEGMIEVLGEGGRNLYHEGKPVHLVLHRANGEAECLRFEEGGDSVWDSDLSYYDRAHMNQVHHFVECIRGGKEPSYAGRDGTRDVRLALAAIRSAVEQRPIGVNEMEEEFTA